MKCSNQVAYGLTIAAGAVLGVAISFCVAAGIANGSFWGAPAAPGLMQVALGFTAAALVALVAVKASFRSYEQCVSRSDCHKECSGNFKQANSAIIGAATAVSAAMAFVTGAIPISWIPWAGAVPIGGALIAVIAASGAVALASGYMVSAVSCVDNCLKAKESSLGTPEIDSPKATTAV